MVKDTSYSKFKTLWIGVKIKKDRMKGVEDLEGIQLPHMNEVHPTEPDDAFGCKFKKCFLTGCEKTGSTDSLGERGKWSSHPLCFWNLPPSEVSENGASDSLSEGGGGPQAQNGFCNNRNTFGSLTGLTFAWMGVKAKAGKTAGPWQ